MVLKGQQRFIKKNELGNSVDAWLEGKTKHDHVSRGLWRVHGKIYDLTDYMTVHPGGQSWLRRTKSMDITDYYQTHHLDRNKTDAILNKYYVCDETNPIDNPYIYSPDNFYGRCKEKVAKLFKTMQSRQATPLMTLFCWTVLIVWALSYQYAIINPSIISTILLGYSLYVLIGVGHNYSHRGNIWGYCLDLTSYPQRLWNITHCLSHHPYCNLELDLEITAFEPFMYFMTCQPQNQFHVIVSQFITFFLLPLMIVGRTIFEMFLGKSKIRFEDVLLPLQFVIAYIVSGLQGLLTLYVAHAISTTMVALFTFPIHRNKDIWTEGDGNPTRDFGIQILRTTAEHNHGLSIIGSMLLFEGFTHHVAHHMFPTIDHSKLHLVTPLVEETCREMGLQSLYPQHEYRNLFTRYFPALIRKRPPVSS